MMLITRSDGVGILRETAIVIASLPVEEPKLDLNLLLKLWEWIWKTRDWNSLEGYFARAMAGMATIAFLLWLLKKGLEWFVSMQRSWKDAGLPVPLSDQQRSEFNRRKSFCKVLYADLATLNKAESWNDQYFTDLEAEVEAEGLLRFDF